jgi:hypothetical protein
LALATGLADFAGVGLFSSSLACPRRRLLAIALSASAVASQRRKRTATERNKERDAINHNEWLKS